MQEVLVQDGGPTLGERNYGELVTSENYINIDEDLSRLSEARREEETDERPVLEPPVVEPITPIDTTFPPTQLMVDDETRSVGERSATEERNDKDSEEEEEEEEVSEEEEEGEEVEEGEEEDEGEDEYKSFRRSIPPSQVRN